MRAEGFTLAVVGAKGGTGKTTTAVSLAVALASSRRPVLLHDLDGQASASLALGHLPATDPLTESWTEDASLHLRLLRGGRGLAGAPIQALRHTLEAHASDAPLRVLDTPPVLGPATLAAVEAANLIIVPLAPNPLELPTLRDVAAIPGVRDRLRAVLVRVHPRRRLSADVAALIEEEYPGVLYRTHIPEDVRAAEAPGYGTPLLTYAPKSKAALAYLALAAEVERDMKRRTK